ncbi:hypothetical protein [Streptomyces tauricus]|uniref:hypothetical protein n=1 Tax=Streptomyces tauricus TaxID=68274 RepID=UPI0033BE9E1B
MTDTGAPSARRASRARVAETASRVGQAVGEIRSWNREKREALRFFRKDLSLKPGATIQDVLDAVGELRGRRIEPIDLPFLPPRVSGVCVLGQEEDYIGLSERLSPLQRARVTLHEVCHLYPFRGGHPTTSPSSHPLTVQSHFEGMTLESLRAQMEVLPERIREEILSGPAMLRAGYPTDEERRCERTARVLLPLLNLDKTSERTGSLIAGFANRRSI